MANANISTVTVTNTFDEWRTRTNDLITDRNILRNHPYVKDNSTFEIANGSVTISRSTGGTLLTIAGGGDALVGGTVTTTDLIVGDDASVANQLTITGNTVSTGNVSVSKNVAITQNANVTGTLNVVSRLDVVGNTFLYSNVAVSKNLTVTQNTTVTGTSNVTGNFKVGADKFVVTAVSGNTLVEGTLDVTGNTLVNGVVNVNNDLIVTGNIISNATANVVNTSVTAVNLGGAAATVRVGSTTGTTVTRNDLSVTGNAAMQSNLSVAQNTSLSGTLTVSGNTTLSDRTFAYNVRSDATGTYWIDSGNASFNNVTITGNLAITQPAVSTSDRIILNELPSVARDGYFIVRRGSASLNATIRFSETAGVWRAGGTDTVSTILLASNLSSSVTNTSTVDAATPSAVKTTFDTATAAYGQANSGFTQANNAYTQANNAYTQANNAYTQANNAYTQANNIISGATPVRLRAYTEGVNTATVTSGSFTADLSGNNIFDLTLSRSGGSTTTVTFANVPASGNSVSATFILRQSSTSANTVIFANTVYWSDGETPVLASGIANKLDTITMFTVNGGTVFYGSHVLANVG